MDEAILATAGIATALLAIGAVVRAVYRAWKRVDEFLTDWNGQPPRRGLPGTPSMPARVSALEQDVAHVKEQVTPNGGTTSTIGDRVVRIESAIATNTPPPEENP